MGRVMPLVDSLIRPPATPALTLAYAQLHIRALGSTDAMLITNWIQAATQYVEEQCGRQLITATREVWLDAFPGAWSASWHHLASRRIEIPHPPLQSIVSVMYVDGNGDLQSVSDGGSPDLPLYLVKAPVGPYAIRGWIEPLAGQVWPIARRESGAVRIQYTCGYGDTDADVPELLRGILCFLVGHFDQFRSAVHEARRGQMLELPYGVQVMLDGFKYSAYPRMVVREDGLEGYGGPWGPGSWV